MEDPDLIFYGLKILNSIDRGFVCSLEKSIDEISGSNIAESTADVRATRTSGKTYFRK